MIIPPSSTNRAWLVSFWMIVSLFIGFLICVFAFFLSPSLRWIVLGVLLTAAIGLFGFLKPGFVSRAYQLWYQALCFYSLQTSQWLMRVCFYLIFIAVGGTKSSLRLKRPAADESQWVPRETLSPAGYASQYVDNPQGFPQQGWISHLMSWALQSNNNWAFCLLPFLIIIRALKTDQESSFPTNIYTLY